MADNTGWHEFICATKATTHIAYVYEDGSIYFPEGPDVADRNDFTYAAARGRVHRLVRADEYEGWRPPARVIKDPAELEALPPRSIVVDDAGFCAQRAVSTWHRPLAGVTLTSDQVLRGGVVTVLYIPTETGEPR